MGDRVVHAIDVDGCKLVHPSQLLIGERLPHSNGDRELALDGEGNGQDTWNIIQAMEADRPIRRHDEDIETVPLPGSAAQNLLRDLGSAIVIFADHREISHDIQPPRPIAHEANEQLRGLVQGDFPNNARSPAHIPDSVL